MSSIPIKELSDSPAIDIALDTISIGKQALVFCNTRRSSESTAEKIASFVKASTAELDELAQKILKVLSTPTRQCKRLASCVKKGSAFHHAGLASGQRELIEDNFRKGIIKVICATPTLAMGINLPAFRAIIKDLKRYGGRWGMEYIPALEYHQMSGRAGRPDFNDKYGEAICIASTEKEAEDILDRFINADAEPIYSKLAVEPALRSYCLSLLATGFAKSKTELIRFFEKTFYGKQYGDMIKLEQIITKILGYLEDWKFIKTESKDDFVSANSLNSDKIEVTKIGERVAQLYVDPYTAHFMIICLERALQKKIDEFSFIHMAVSTLELRPLASVRVAEVGKIESLLPDINSSLIVLEPSVFEPEYDEFLKTLKTSLALNDWMDEKNEEEILEEYNIPPGELHLKKNLADWILYSCDELCNMLDHRELSKTIRKTRFRLDKGVKEELIPLARIRNIGRIRARLLFRNGIKDLGDIKKADITKLSQLIGKKTAESIKKESGEEIKEPISERKRKGQMSIEKYE